ncbi:MAG: hypothetical protein Q7U68_07675 [Candidatus Roizmanbacteria bacterium]|nr:hypothetical protein [Candidatus Roizmanbacteria bacterium]
MEESGHEVRQSNLEPGSPRSIWKITGPPVDEKFVVKLVNAASERRAEDGLIGKGNLLAGEDWTQYDVDLQLGINMTKKLLTTKKHLNAALIISKKEGVESLNLKRMGDNIKLMKSGHLDNEQLIITKYRDKGVELILKRRPKNNDIAIEFRQCLNPNKINPYGFDDISPQGMINLAQTMIEITPEILEMVFLSSGEKIATGKIHTNRYNSYTNLLEQLTRLSKEHGPDAESTTTDDGDYVRAPDANEQLENLIKIRQQKSIDKTTLG